MAKILLVEKSVELLGAQVELSCVLVLDGCIGH